MTLFVLPIVALRSTSATDRAKHELIDGHIVQMLAATVDHAAIG